MSDKPALGFIGVGLMGRPMVLRLLAAGYRVSAWNRSRDKLAAVSDAGALPADSPAAAASASDIVMMCVTDQHAGSASISALCETTTLRYSWLILTTLNSIVFPTYTS